jgi:hypothetical protein
VELRENSIVYNFGSMTSSPPEISLASFWSSTSGSAIIIQNSAQSLKIILNEVF